MAETCEHMAPPGSSWNVARHLGIDNVEVLSDAVQPYVMTKAS